MLNKAQIIGHLGADPELKYTQSQTPVATFNVATTKKWKNQAGEAQEKTEWHRVVVWQKLAEVCAKHLAKGRQVYVEGELSTRSWEDKDGVKRYTTEIIGQTVQFLGSAKEGGARPPAPGDESKPAQQSRGGNGSSKGQQAQHQQPPPDESYGGPETPGLDDIPF